MSLEIYSKSLQDCSIINYYKQMNDDELEDVYEHVQRKKREQIIQDVYRLQCVLDFVVLSNHYQLIQIQK